MIRGTALSNYPRLVQELGGDPADLLRAVGIRLDDVGNSEIFIPFRAAVTAIESAAVTTATPDFGRRLARRQGIEILGPVGVAARTAASVADAFVIFEKFMAAYSPAISATITSLPEPGRSFYQFRFVLDNLPPTSQSIELALGVSLGVFRLMLGADYVPMMVHLPHKALSSAADYRTYFGCAPRFGERTAGFTVRNADLGRPLNEDQLAHQAVVSYLNTITQRDASTAQSVRTLVGQLLPTGAVTMKLVATQFNLHPKALQRRLASEGEIFGELVDDVRRGMAERYLRDTDMTLSHLSRELGYSEQSVLTRSCRRWFGASPAAYRRSMRQ